MSDQRARELSDETGLLVTWDRVNSQYVVNTPNGWTVSHVFSEAAVYAEAGYVISTTPANSR